MILRKPLQQNESKLSVHEFGSKQAKVMFEYYDLFKEVQPVHRALRL